MQHNMSNAAYNSSEPEANLYYTCNSVTGIIRCYSGAFAYNWQASIGFDRHNR